ncbi:CRP-like cAMP-binding protein [Rhizobium rosettiformans]|uniref:Crp/Fnr family transcriptional regulator n=2 Tax=Rhizobium rosettiformans TaxID=1368430 RepID=A0A4V4HRS4_9HYPH|nr:Crp/Fnr family transcriptional regulator [Rhizobium rosettiformans]MBB5275142.1 CRP-like cAMP-binding protein [Rhizobium rosettiformans]THV39036.1 Crp/Fnr family transcriptional regulator [Rhizobium rosettiformans W3]
MAIEPSPSPIRVSCFECPLRHMKRFRPFTEAELEFVSSFKRGELIADPGTTVLVEGARSAHLYTVLSGWGFRYKILEDGRRQILNYIVPGDMIGLQGAVMAEMQHSVEALTPMTLCVFERSRLFSLFELHPGLGFDLTWLAAREECILDEHLLSIGRRSALERSSYLLAFLFDRGVNAGILGDNHRHIPATQMHFADTLGLSIVHTNKTLKKLADRGLIRWRERGCDIIDPVGLQEIASWTPGDPRVRPFI